MQSPIPTLSLAVRHASLATLIATSFAAFAETFTLVPAESVVTLSGSAVGVDFEAQGPGSLQSTFSGTIIATLGANSITFPGGSSIVAANSGDWSPMADGAVGNAPANYGAKASNPIATANAAARKLKIDVNSAAIAVAADGFASTDTDFSVPQSAGAVIDYRVTGLFNDAGPLEFAGGAENQAAAKGTLVTVGNTQTLTLPVDVTYLFELISPGDTVVHLTGMFVATRTVEGGGGDDTFESWVLEFFPGQNDPAVIGPEADPEGDGVPNFPEFAFGLNPTQPNAGFSPLGVKLDPANPDVLTLEFTRPVGLQGVRYHLRTSEDFANWTPLDIAPTITDLGNGTERVTFRDTQSILGATRPRYIQLQVTKL